MTRGSAEQQSIEVIMDMERGLRVFSFLIIVWHYVAPWGGDEYYIDVICSRDLGN